jgi:hypothetical protein
VLSDAVDIPAIDAMWCGNPGQPPPAPEAAVRRPPDPPNASPPIQPTPPAAALTPTEPQPQPDPPPDPAEDPAPDAPAPDATTSVWTRTRWTRAPAGPARSCATAPARQAATAQSPEPPRDDVSPMPRQARPQPTRWRPPLPRNRPGCPTRCAPATRAATSAWGRAQPARGLAPGDLCASALNPRLAAGSPAEPGRAAAARQTGSRVRATPPHQGTLHPSRPCRSNLSVLIP